MNILVSILTVKAWGLIGVAIGTLVAMTYQTMWLAVYDSRHFIFWSLKNVTKQFAIDTLSAALIIVFGSQMSLKEPSYINWIFMAVNVAVMALVVVVGMNLVFYKNRVKQLANRLWRKNT